MRKRGNVFRSNANFARAAWGELSKVVLESLRDLLLAGGRGSAEGIS